MTVDSVARRLALLAGVPLEADDLATVVAEFEDFDRALPELAAFASSMPWPAVQVQPYPRRRARRATGAPVESASRGPTAINGAGLAVTDPCALGLGAARRLLDARDLSSLE